LAFFASAETEFGIIDGLCAELGESQSQRPHRTQLRGFAKNRSLQIRVSAFEIEFFRR